MDRQLQRFGLILVSILLLTACGGPTTPAAAPETEVPPTATTTSEPVAASVDEQLAPEPVPKETYYAPFPLSITLDGELDDWDNVPRVTMPKEAEEYPDLPSITFAATADDDYLYFMGDVIDDNIISGEHADSYWNEDSVEFYVNATGDLSLPSYEDGVAQITVPALNIERSIEDAVIAGVRGDRADAQVAATKTESGYAVEVAVPLENDVWSIQPEHGNVIGFQVHLNGASTADRDLKLIWSAADKADNSYQDPSLFGKLVFFEIGRTEVTEAEPTPKPTQIPVDEDAAYKQSELPIEERVDDLLARMTLAEKIGQMTQIEKNSISVEQITDYGIGSLLSGGGGYPSAENTPEAWLEMVNGYKEAALQTRLGIPLIYGVDAVHGHNNVKGAVIFPHNIGLGAANDPDLMQRIGEVTAVEVAATSIDWNFGPTVAVAQDIRWGRTYESYSEKTDIVSDLAIAYLNGLQGESLADPQTILATPKHFVGDGGTVWGTSTTNNYMIDQGVTEADEATLRAVHLPPYEAAIDAGAQSIMISFSSWGGMKMHAQKYLITDVLKGELGFEGFTVSDWGGIDQITPNYYDAVVTAINAGIDMNMVPYDHNRFINTLTKAVESGDVPMDRIDDAVRRILTVKFKLGLFERPTSDSALLDVVGSDEHRAVAREAVAKSLVLLKNDDGVLPLSKETPLINVAGVAADDIGVQSGGWTIEWQGRTGDITPGTTILEAIQNTVSEDTTVAYNKHGRFDTPAEVCIAVVGEEPYAEGLGDTDNLTLPVGDKRMLKRLPDQCENITVILLSGRPLVVTDVIQESDAFVAAWLPGTEGQGVADVLFGDVPFTGNLSFTWPRTNDQLPFDFDQLPTEGCAAPLFPFGYGLTTEDTDPLVLPDCP
jgi:beta-glucosidase